MSVLQRGDRLVVSELSRLGRSLGQIVAILDALAKAGVVFVALKENIHVEGKLADPSRCPSNRAGELDGPLRSGPCIPQHPREHVVRKQADVVGEHAEDESVDEVRNEAATRSVSDCRVSPGRSRSGSENAHFSRRASTRRPSRPARTRASG